jgi:hypothetical protein
MEILKGHTSKETAYVVNDYPYGFRLRCKIRYWLEFNQKRGVRFVSQTTNPKKAGEVWNKEKASTYCYISGAMFLDEENHVTWNGLSEYGDLKEAMEFKEKYFDGVPEEGKQRLLDWIETKRRYEEKRDSGIDYQVAGRETVIEIAKNGGNTFIQGVDNEKR